MERWKDRQINGSMERQTQMDGRVECEIDKDRWMDRWKDRQVEWKTDRWTNGQVDGEMERQMHR